MKYNDILFGNSYVQHYQPIVDMHSMNLAGYEALLRPIGFAKDTESIINEMERAGVIHNLDAWSLEAAISRLSQLAGIPKINVNLSAISLCSQEFHAIVELMLADKPQNIKIGFEITESRPISNINLAKKFILMVQEYGCTVSLDDFGVGYAKFSTAKDLGLNGVKISSRLTTAIEKNDAVKSLIGKVVKTANDCGMHLVAEHIDNPLQYIWLRDAGIDFGQGWLFAKASPRLEKHHNYKQEVGKSIQPECRYLISQTPGEGRRNTLAFEKALVEINP